MSVKIISAQVDPQSVFVGAGYRLIIGVEAYGVLEEYMGYILTDSNGAELHTADSKDYTLHYTDVEINESIGWLLDLGGN